MKNLTKKWLLFTIILFSFVGCVIEHDPVQSKSAYKRQKKVQRHLNYDINVSKY